MSSIVSPLEEALKVTEQLTDQQKEKIEKHSVSKHIQGACRNI